uniref:Uncharacterized protein n=1 Tax=Opuntia streptacantha TaxID=393608 RepID=A0A7C9AES7_OPUST
MIAFAHFAFPPLATSADVSSFCLFAACPADSSLLTPVACFASSSSCRRNSFRFCSSIFCFFRSSSKSSRFSIFFCTTGGALGLFEVTGLRSQPTVMMLSGILGRAIFEARYWRSAFALLTTAGRGDAEESGTFREATKTLLPLLMSSSAILSLFAHHNLMKRLPITASGAFRAFSASSLLENCTKARSLFAGI